MANGNGSKGNGSKGNGSKLPVEQVSRMPDCAEKELKPREKALVEALVDPTDGRAMSQKALAMGYKNGRQVYEFVNRPHIARAIKEASDKWMTSISNIRRAKVLIAVADRAEKASPPDARTFFQVTDDIQSGTNVAVTAIQTNESQVRQSRKDRVNELIGEVCEPSE